MALQNSHLSQAGGFQTIAICKTSLILSFEFWQKLDCFNQHRYILIFLSSATYSHFFLLTFLGLGNEKNSVESFVYLRTEMTWLTLRSLGSRLRGENNMFIQEMIFTGGGSKPFSRKDKYLLSGIRIDTVFRVPVNFATSIKIKWCSTINPEK